MSSALWDPVEKVYNQMKAEAVEHEGRLIYTGYLTKLFRDLDVSVPYYGKVTKVLTDMGCIMQLRRGGGTTPSQWVINKPLSRADYDALSPKLGRKWQVDNQRLDAVEQQVQDLRTALAGINVAAALATIQQQVNQLEGGLKLVQDTLAQVLERRQTADVA